MSSFVPASGVSPEPIRVAIALVADRGRHLIGRRSADQLLGGYWEFPGGKCLPEETPEACAIRECLEETGLRIEVMGLRADVECEYSYGRLHLFFFDCRLADSSASAPERLETFRWVPTRNLGEYIFPPGNEAIIAALTGAEGTKGTD